MIISGRRYESILTGARRRILIYMIKFNNQQAASILASLASRPEMTAFATEKESYVISSVHVLTIVGFSLPFTKSAANIHRLHEVYRMCLP